MSSARRRSNSTHSGGATTGSCRRAAEAWLVASLVVAASACGARSQLYDHDAGDPPPVPDSGIDAGHPEPDAGHPEPDAGEPCVDDRPVVIEWDAEGEELDLLFVLDNSGSMLEEQRNLIANQPELVDALTTPSDLDGDGVIDSPGVASIHLGVVSTDMGIDIENIGCREPGSSDDGVLQNRPPIWMAGCEREYPRFLTYDVDAPDPDLATDFGCIARLGTGGCGIEQPLAAAEKALTVHVQPGGANEGFLRPEALLAILFVTDENDCSISNPEALEGYDIEDETPLCYGYPDALWPVDDLAARILGIKDPPERLIVAAITGIPPDLVGRPYAEVLEDPRMEEVLDPDDEVGLVASCEAEDLGRAHPPRRIVELVEIVVDGGASGTVESICEEDWRPAVTAITRVIQQSVDSGCLPRPLRGSGDALLDHLEHADCALHEVRPDGGGCAAGRVRIGTEEGRTVCHVCQRGDGLPPNETDWLGNDVRGCAGSADGWSYSTEDPSCGGLGKVDLSLGEPPLPGAVLRLTCTDEALPSPCDPGERGGSGS